MKKLLLFLILIINQSAFPLETNVKVPKVSSDVKALVAERDKKIANLYAQANIPKMLQELQGLRKKVQPKIVSLVASLTELKKNPIKNKDAIKEVDAAINHVLSVNGITNLENKINSAIYGAQNKVSQIKQEYNTQILQQKKQKR